MGFVRSSPVKHNWMDVISNDVHRIAQCPLSKKPQEKSLESLPEIPPLLLSNMLGFHVMNPSTSIAQIFTAGPNSRRQNMHLAYLNWI